MASSKRPATESSPKRWLLGPDSLTALTGLAAAAGVVVGLAEAEANTPSSIRGLALTWLLMRLDLIPLDWFKELAALSSIGLEAALSALFDWLFCLSLT